MTIRMMFENRDEFRKELGLGAVEIVLISYPAKMAAFVTGDQLVAAQIAELRAFADALESTPSMKRPGN